MEELTLHEAILGAIDEGVCAMDRDGVIVCFNAAAERITGTPRVEALGRPCSEAFRSGDCECACLVRDAVGQRQELRDRATVIPHRNGACLPVRLSALPIHDADGEVQGTVVVFRDVSVLEQLRRELLEGHVFGDIVSKSPAIQRILDILPDIADSDSTVLILGPSGSGKELFARAIHDLSPRQDAPFVAVNCGALPDTLLESELFGYKKGAFTDAKGDKPGRFALAQGGTLFLDEIGDLSPAMQVKLLRVLQEKEFEPLGATGPVKADLRVLAATNRDLHALVADGSFRTDLFYRLNVVEIMLPPLSERLEDIPLLLDHFIERFNAEKGRDIHGVSPETLERLLRYTYPGNIRELENIVEHAFILCRGDEIQEQCLPRSVLVDTVDPCPAGFARSHSQREVILAALRRANGNRTEAAAALGINKSTLWRRMKRLGIAYPASR